MSRKPDDQHDPSWSAFTDLVKKLVRVPKRELDAKIAEHRAARHKRHPVPRKKPA